MVINKFDRIEIGKKFQQFRKELKLSQYEFAKEFNTSQPTIAGIEKGEKKPTIEMLITIAIKYPNKILWLLTSKESHPLNISDLSKSDQITIHHLIEIFRNYDRHGEKLLIRKIIDDLHEILTKVIDLREKRLAREKKIG